MFRVCRSNIMLFFCVFFLGGGGWEEDWNIKIWSLNFKEIIQSASCGFYNVAIFFFGRESGEIFRLRVKITIRKWYTNGILIRWKPIRIYEIKFRHFDLQFENVMLVFQISRKFLRSYLKTFQYFRGNFSKYYPVNN